MRDGAVVVGYRAIVCDGFDLRQGVVHGDGDVGFLKKLHIVAVIADGDHAPLPENVQAAQIPQTTAFVYALG